MRAEKRTSQLIGVSGVHFVAARLSHLGFHAVPTSRNVEGPDLLVSSISGAQSLAIQVKTTEWAERTRGRGKAKKPDHLEWDIGWSSARINHPHLFFALVDLKHYHGLPDVYVLPSAVIYAYFRAGDPATWPRARYHPPIADVERFKNDAGWELLREELNASTA